MDHASREVIVDVSSCPGVGRRTWIEQAQRTIDAKRSLGHAVDNWRLWNSIIHLEEVQEHRYIRVRHVFLFDINDVSTLLLHLDGMVDYMRGEDPERHTGVAILVGNKRDLVADHNAAGVEETRRVARRLAEEGGFIYAETSATTGEGMEEALYLLLDKESREPMEDLIA